jgi:NADH dehydrogenase/NADH:ubiquinone oxidoreductase subunit G
VEWWYDGLKGKIIPWTLENGGKSHDPSILAFVVDFEGKVVSKIDTNKAYQPKAFADWLKEQADQWERDHPRTRIPFMPAEVTLEGEGTDTTPVCAALDEAREAKKSVVIYVGNEADKTAPKKDRAEAAKARKFEKKTLNSKKAAKAAEGWVLLRLDRSKKAHRALADGLGVKEAPSLVLIVDGKEPLVLKGTTSGSALAYKLEKGWD